MVGRVMSMGLKGWGQSLIMGKGAGLRMVGRASLRGKGQEGGPSQEHPHWGVWPRGGVA